jgi:hypothetical protein
MIPAEALKAIRSRAEAVASNRADPYGAARDMWQVAMSATGQTTDGEHCHGLWLIWGALTDWVEQRPEERPQAEAAIRRFATEWLAVCNAEAGWRPFLDHWIYAEMGYERPKGQTP